jgi:hypothetical protein
MLKATFDIAPVMPGADELMNSQLLMEVGEKVFSYTFYSKHQQRFLGFRQYALDFIPGKPALESLQDILQGDELLQHHFRETYIVYNFSDSNLLPEKCFHIELNKPVIELVYGNARKGLLLSEKVYGWNLFNVYRIPREIHALLQQKFAAGKYWHYYTLLLSAVAKEETTPGNVVKVVIAADQFVAAVFKEKDLQLLQTYSYQTPDDVSYNLLAVCQQLHLSPEEITLKVSGLIDEQSILYQELMKYFLHLQWEVLPDSIGLQDDFLQFPPHYFSPLMKMALCV